MPWSGGKDSLVRTASTIIFLSLLTPLKTPAALTLRFSGNAEAEGGDLALGKA